jgi:hypothetical protein
VYSTIYKGAEAQFELLPMPRLEISSIEDLKILHEIGVLQPEHTLDLASILLGKLKKAKKNPLDTFGQTPEKQESKKDERQQPKDKQLRPPKDQ